MSDLRPACKVAPDLWVGPHPERDPGKDGFHTARIFGWCFRHLDLHPGEQP